MSHLIALRDIINEGIATIESVYAARGESVPSLDNPFQPPSFDVKELLGPSNAVIAVAAQLIATLTPPPLTVFAASTAVREFSSGNFAGL